MHTAENRDTGALSKLSPNIVKEWLNELRVGSNSARIVANKLDRAAEHLITQSKEEMTREEIVETYLRLSPELQQIAITKIREIIESRP